MPTESSLNELEQTHVDEEHGLWIPPELREFDSQVVFRTPRGTIQHFSSNPLDGYYGFIDSSSFGDDEDLHDVRNSELVPNKVSIKLQGEDPVILEVDTNASIP